MVWSLLTMVELGLQVIPMIVVARLPAWCGYLVSLLPFRIDIINLGATSLLFEDLKAYFIYNYLINKFLPLGETVVYRVAFKRELE